MRDSGSEHFKKLILQFKLLIFYQVSDWFDHDHDMRRILVKDFLSFESDDFLLWTHHFPFIYVLNDTIR